MLRQGMQLLLVCMIFILPERAMASCWFDPGQPYNATRTLTMPINPTIAVTPDLPVNQTVYDQNVITAKSGTFNIQCSGSGTFYRGFEFATPVTETSPGSKTYPTGLPGIGMKFGFQYGASYYDFPRAFTTGCNGSSCLQTGGLDPYFWILLVKTDSTVTPGTIDASTFPPIIFTYGQNGSMVELFRINMTGTIHVTVPTCNITAGSKAMVVKMGKHKLSDFSGQGSYSDWVDASLHLEGCGQFYGYGKKTNATFDGTNVNPVNAFVSNYFNVSLTPLDGVVNVGGSGVMKIKQQASGAVGFGIQLSRSQNNSGVLNLSGTSYNYTDPLPKTGATTLTVPLYARYIQTAANAIAGKADGMLEYTISYK